VSVPSDFDPIERAASVKAAEFRRDHIAESTARLMRHAKSAGWGPQVGLPTLAGDTLVFHFETGKRGFVRLPQGSEF